MGAVQDAINLAWRDFVTEGVPASGPNEPRKVEIRAVGAVIEQFLAVAGIDKIYETTAAGIAATTSGDLFLVKGTGDSFADLYKNASGSAVYQDISLPSTAGIDQRLLSATRTVQTFADRDAIPSGDRYDGMQVKVAAADQWFQWDDAVNDWKTPLEFVENTVAFETPPIIDRGYLYFPSFRLLRYRQNGYGDFYSPAAGALFAGQEVSATSEIRRHVFDGGIYAEELDGIGSPTDAQKAAAAQAALVIVDGNDTPLVDTDTQVILAVTAGGKIVDSKGWTFVGDVPGGAVVNQFRYGKEVDETPFVYPGDVAATITDTNLVALGFTRGIRGEANSIVAAGGYLDENPKAGDFICARFYLHTSVSGQFGQPRVYLYESEPTADYVVPTLLRVISSTVREYFYAGRIADADRLKWAVGTDNSANASIVTIAGIQFHVGPDPAYWIGSNDYPSPPGWGSGSDPLLSDELFLVSDRPTPFFPANGLAKRSLPAIAELSASPAIDPPVPPYFDSGRASDLFWLDPTALGDNLKISMRADDAPHIVSTRTVAINTRAVPLASPVSINCAYFGDSLSNDNFSPDLKALLAAWNVDINFHGTLANNAGETAEGRGGWSLANYIGTRQGSAWSSVVAAGSPATTAYLAGDYTARLNAQPFLNNGSSGSAAPVISGGPANGYRFDLVNYRTRFALPTIDIVLLNIWSNDMNLVPASDGLADVVALYPVMLAEIRRAWPSAKILCWASAPGFVNNAELRWRERRPALEAILSAIREQQDWGDTSLHFASAWMHHTVRSAFDLSTGTTDDASSVNRATVADDIHTSRPADAQAHEAVAAAIVNII
ncbi:hypothetical protein HHL08_15855 [Sphingobium sp. AR-3-1]|uniref:SGNH/GDSL hydrolase family protein n=1 Tax=Sphingobium psychrophilum TaxID=2728834 RepID=A0A7X9ZT03_9SPHN|nr:hypothetical protein [Sphingobium psychrophilum]NML11605.1 hypothetical protein [Sphingobium psychrophilum]